MGYIFITKGKTNWKFITIVVVLALIVGGGILGYMSYFRKEMISLTKFPEVKTPEEIIEKEKKEAKIEHLEIIPSKKVLQNIIYYRVPYYKEEDVKAVVTGKNLGKVELLQRGGAFREQPRIIKGTDIKREILEDKEKWEITLPRLGYLRGYLLEFCAVGFDLSEERIGEVCLHKVFGDIDGSKEITISKEKTIDWRVYRDEDYGFEFKYPPSFKLSENAKNKEFYESVEKTSSLTDIENRVIDMLVYKKSEWENRAFCQTNDYYCHYEEINNLPVFVNSSATPIANFRDISILMDEFVVMFHGEVSDIYPAMLSTFRFLE